MVILADGFCRTIKQRKGDDMRPVSARIWKRAVLPESKGGWAEVEGIFCQWGNAYEEFEAGPGNYTLAIIELPDGQVVTALPEDVKFLRR